MNADPAPRIVITRQFTVSASRVFDAWLDPQIARRWLFATETGNMVRAETDPRVGGKFNFTERRDGEDVEHVGEYLEIDSPRRLVFTFGVPKYSPDMSRVIIDILPQGTGCELTLTHEGVLGEWAEQTKAGWTKLMGRLADAIHTPEQDYGVITAPDTVRFERPLPGPIERVWSYLVDSDKRGQWFASGEMPPHVGGVVTLYFDHQGLSPIHAPPPEKFKNMPTEMTFNNTVTIFEPPTRLGLGWVEGTDPSEVIFELTPEGDKVRLTLTHRRLANRAAMFDVSGGWHTHLAVLTERLHNRTPPAFWTVFGDIEEQYVRRYAQQP